MNTGTIKSYLHQSLLQSVVVCAVILTITYFFEELFFTATAFFWGPFGFYGGCADDADGSAGGCSSGDSDSDSGVGGPGCGYCDGGDNSFDSDTSTPYLYIKKKNGEYAMQNDVMIGTPSTYVHCKEEGEARRRADMLGKDVYPVSLADIDAKRGIELQIREIEPEESFIYNAKCHFYNTPADAELLQDWTHQKLYALEESKIRSFTGKVVFNDKLNVQDRLYSRTVGTHEEAKEKAVRLERGDTLTFTLRKENVEARDVHLVVSSFWRNWMPGMDADEIHGIAERAKHTTSYSHVLKKQIKRAVARATTTAMVLGGLFFGTNAAVNNTDQNDDDLLAFIKKANFAQMAYADTPHTTGGDASLKVSYRHPSLGMYVHLATVQPRVYMPTDISVALPKEAFRNDGSADIMIEATKAHYVKNISVFEGDAEEVKPVSTKQFAKAQLGDADVTDKLQNSENEEPLHMVAGDTLELKTEPVTEEYTHMALEIHGFYTPLSAEQKEKVGDWQAKLPQREQKLIAGMYV